MGSMGGSASLCGGKRAKSTGLLWGAALHIIALLISTWSSSIATTKTSVAPTCAKSVLSSLGYDLDSSSAINAGSILCLCQLPKTAFQRTSSKNYTFV